MEKVLRIFNEIKGLDICVNKGLSNPCENERQYLYGDISDWLRDNNHFGLSQYEEEILIKLIIGDYVIKHCLL